MQQKFYFGLSPLGFHRVAYTVWGENKESATGKKSVPVVCVHGLTRNGRDFDVLAQQLAKQHPLEQRSVYCPDIVGRGKSDWLKDPLLYGYPQYLADLTALIAVIQTTLDTDVIDWVGTSMGGLIGMMIAAAANNPIRKLVINDVGPFLSFEGLKRIGDYVGLTPEFSDEAAVIRYFKVNYAPFGIKNDDDWARLARHSTRQLPNGKMTLAHDPGLAKNFQNLKGDVDLWSVYDKISCPTLVLHGLQSDILSQATADQMTKRGPKAKLVEWPDVGHAPALMDQSQIRVIEDFLRA